MIEAAKAKEKEKAKKEEKAKRHKTRFTRGKPFFFLFFPILTIIERGGRGGAIMQPRSQGPILITDAQYKATALQGTIATILVENPDDIVPNWRFRVTRYIIPAAVLHPAIRSFPINVMELAGSILEDTT